MKVHISIFSVSFLNANINWQTRKPEAVSITVRSRQTWQTPWVDWYRFQFGPPRCKGIGFEMDLQLNGTMLVVWIWIVARLPTPVAYPCIMTCLIRWNALCKVWLWRMLNGIKSCTSPGSSHYRSWPNIMLKVLQRQDCCIKFSKVPFADRFYYQGCKKTQNQPVQFQFLPNSSLNYVHQYWCHNIELGTWYMQLCMAHLFVLSNARYL